MKISTQPRSPLLMRADAGPQMGAGHAMRCLALAQSWQRIKGDVQFAMAQSTPPIEARLRDEGLALARIEVEPGSDDDARRTVECARAWQSSWIVADGYHFGARWQRLVKGSGFKLLLLDDYGHARHYWADLVLNQNLGASAALYRRREPRTSLLLGSRYALLRREFSLWQGWYRNTSAEAKKILVTLGGSDPHNVTQTVIQAFRKLPANECEAAVVVGPANPHVWELKSQTAKSGIRLIQNAPNMPELMAWADLAVSAAGSTCWELAYMQLPAILIVVADNQTEVAARLQARGAAINLGNHCHLDVFRLHATLQSLLADAASRARMSRKAHRLVDGLGAERVVMKLDAPCVPSRCRRAIPPSSNARRLAKEPN